MVEREEEAENKSGTDNLAARVQKLEEQVREMRQRMSEAMGFTGEENASWRRDGAGGAWQRWKRAWWVKVGGQNLNSRQRSRVSKGLQRLVARGQNEMIRLLTELKNEIRAEVATASASNSRAQQCGSSSDDECLGAAAARRYGGVDGSWRAIDNLDIVHRFVSTKQISDA